MGRYLYDGATPVIAKSIKELAEMLEINPDALIKTVEEFNNAVVEDRPFNELIRDGRATKGLYPAKTNWSQKLDTPPYTAYAATCGLTFTYGGLKINPDCQVLNKSDRAIPGLYAAGELTAGILLLQLSQRIGTSARRCDGKNCRHKCRKPIKANDNEYCRLLQKPYQA